MNFIIDEKLPSLSVVIPAYNDGKTVGFVVNEADAIASKITDDYEVIVLDDGSSDDTLKVISDLAEKNSKILVRRHLSNAGYGRTIKELYLAANKDLVFSCPGDGQIPPSQMTKMLSGLNVHDIVIGHRKKRQDSFKRRIQTQIYNFILRCFYHIKTCDINSVKLFRRDILKDIDLVSDSPFVDAELCIKAYKKGYSVGEVVIEHLPRKFKGNSGGKTSIILSTFRDLMDYRKKIGKDV